MNAVTNIKKNIQQGQIQEAINECMYSLKCEYHAQVYELGAQIAIKLREEKRFQEGRDFLLGLQAIWPEKDKSLGFYMELGHALRQHQDFMEAITAYQTVISKNPHHPWGIFWLAKCYYVTGNVSEAKSVMANYTFPQDIAVNLFGEVQLLEIDIAIAEQRFDCLIDHYRLLAQRVGELPKYILLFMIDKLQLANQSEIVFRCLITFAFCHHEQELLFKIAKLFNAINNIAFAIVTLFRIHEKAGLQEYQWNLLIASVLTASDYERGDVWHKAKLLIDDEYHQREKKHGYWQYWTDYWDEPTEQSIKYGKNSGVELATTLGNFNTLFWTVQQKKRTSTGCTEIPKNIFTYSLNTGGGSQGRLKEQLQMLAKDYSVEHFDPVAAAKYIADNCTNRIRRAWRLSRNPRDKKSLFTLCYLVKHGGYLLTAMHVEAMRSFMNLAQSVPSLLLVRGELGISTSLLAAKPNHPLLVAILETIVQSLINRTRLPDLYVTGAICWARVLIQYNAEMLKRGKVPDFCIIDGLNG